MKDQFEGNCQSISYQFITKLVREDWLSLQGVAEPSSEHAEQTSPRTHPVSVEITRQYQFIHHFPSLTKPLIKACFQDNILYSIQETKKPLSNDWTLLRSLLFLFWISAYTVPCYRQSLLLMIVIFYFHDTSRVFFCSEWNSQYQTVSILSIYVYKLSLWKKKLF